jgi:DNA-binding NtrC family response regulator
LTATRARADRTPRGGRLPRPSDLVVDDEPDILRAFELSYGDDFRILTANAGVQALDVLRAEDVSVIVSDQRMPSMDGSEFLERSMAVRPNAVRIVLTGYTDIDALVRAVNRSRIYRYLAKPWDDEEMRAALTRAIELFQLTRENERLVEELRRANERLAAENAYLRTSASDDAASSVRAPSCARCSALVDKVAPHRAPCSCRARPAPARSSSRARSTSGARAPSGSSWPSTARR